MYEEVPDELKNRSCWVCWMLIQKSGQSKPSKIPINPLNGYEAKSNAPSTWSSYDQALLGLSKFKCSGIGFMLGNGVFGVDIDNCIIDGVFSDEANDIIKIMDSYTELSPSRTGVHILAFGKKPEGKCRKGNIEMYDCGRFFTVTGDAI